MPDRIRGRIFGFDGALITFTLSASNALCGWLAGVYGVRAVMTGVGVAVAAYAAIVWAITRRTIDRLPADRSVPVRAADDRGEVA